MGRPTCKLGNNTRLFSSANILNAGKLSELISVADHSIIKGELMVFGHAGKLEIGSWCYIGEGSRIWSASSISIGDRVLISHNVNVFDSLTHPLSAKSRHQQFVEIATTGHPSQIDLAEKPIVISSDVLIGACSTILRGVTIGEGAIVAAGAVVTKNVAPYTVVAGNPAKFVRELGEDGR